MKQSRANPTRTTRAEAARRHNRQSEIGNRQSSAGFTLMEVMLATVIVGTAVLAIVSAQQAYHQHNAWSQKVGTALLLANEVREMTMDLPQHDPISGDAVWGPENNEPSVSQFDDLDDFDGTGGVGVSFSPPIDAGMNEVPNLPGWSQEVIVENVLDGFINGSAAPDKSTDMVRITCRVLYQSPQATEPMEITRLTWVRAGGP